MNYVQLLFPDFSLIVCGYLVCRYTALNRTVWQQVEALVYYFLFPVLLFQSIVKNPLDLGAASSLIAAGLVTVVAGILLSYSVARIPGVNARDHASSAQVAFRFNSFIALALAERVAGPQGLSLLAVLIGVCVPLCNIAAVWPMARHSEHGLAREVLRNPLVIATVAGLLTNVSGLHIPNWADPTVTRIGQASLAMGLMAAGAGMQLSELASAKRLGLAILTIRHLLLPVLAFSASWLLGLTSAQASVLLLFSAVPTASSAYVLASRMGYNGALVAALVTLSTLLSVLSLPFALGPLRALLGH
jgi:malonate transporter and related proteins